MRARHTVPAIALAVAVALLPTTRVLAAEPAPAAVVLTEIDEDGGETAIATNGQQVDVNSTLRLSISRMELHRRVAQAFGGSTAQARIDQLIKREHDIADAASAASRLGPLYVAYAKDPARNANELHGTVARVNRLVGPLEKQLLAQAAQDPQLRAELAQATAHMNSLELGNFVLKYAAESLRQDQQAAERAADLDGTYVQIAGTLNRLGHSTPLHFPGLDTNANGEYYDVPRWSYLPSDGQLKSLQASAQQIDHFNSAAPGSLQDALTAFVRAQGPAVTAAIKHLQDVLDADVKAVDPSAKDLLQQIADLRALSNVLRSDLDDLSTRFASTTPASTAEAKLSVLAGTLNALQKLYTDALGIVARLNALPATLNGLGALLAEWKNLEQPILDLYNAFGAANMLAPVTLAAADFNAHVLKLGLADVPAASELDLHNAGRRDAGDTVVIGVRIGKNQLAPVDVETHRVKLARILFHTEPQAGWLLAQNPNFQPNGATNAFSLAPSLGVLFKGGWRGTGWWPFLWSEVLTPGAGISMAALDLQHTGNVEIGLGAELSLVHDWVQLGEGYDFARGTPYFFVGSQLPLSALQVLMP